MKPQMLILALVFAALPSCNSQLPLMVPEAEPENEAMAKGWLSLSDGTFHENGEGLTPEGCYVKGFKKSWKTFHPTTGILGKQDPPPKSAKTQPAWIELDDGSIHPVQEAVVPRPPYVRGLVDENGRFYPGPREIVK
ncbi:MAG: hypothetical protein GXP25_19990 [Planctomycetes bacterium]|nr:hypothetical protein [Planctomycetota bacterium]